MQPSRRHRLSSTTRRLSAGVIAFVCVLGLAGQSVAIEPPASDLQLADETERWQVLESLAEGFRGLLPQDETWEESGLRETIAGTVKEKKYFGRANGRTFSIGLHRLPDLGRFFAPTGLVLSTAKKNVLRTNGGKQVSYERQRMGNYPGALLTFEPKDAAGDWKLMEVRLVLVGSRLFVLKATDPDSTGDRSDVDRFFESFEVIE